jgi:hypothetical protein
MNLNICLQHKWQLQTVPQWFNTGLNYKYDLTGPQQGFWYVDPKTGNLTPVKIHIHVHSHMHALYNLLTMT